MQCTAVGHSVKSAACKSSISSYCGFSTSRIIAAIAPNQPSIQFAARLYCAVWFRDTDVDPFAVKNGRLERHERGSKTSCKRRVLVQKTSREKHQSLDARDEIMDTRVSRSHGRAKRQGIGELSCMRTNVSNG